MRSDRRRRLGYYALCLVLLCCSALCLAVATWAGSKWVFPLVDVPPEQVDASAYQIDLLFVMACSFGSAMSALTPLLFFTVFRGGELLAFRDSTSRRAFFLATAGVSAPGLALGLHTGYLLDVVIFCEAGLVTLVVAASYSRAWKQSVESSFYGDRNDAHRIGF